MCYFYEGITHNFHFAAKRMKVNVLNIEYHSNSLETSSRCKLLILHKDWSIWAMQKLIFDFWKKSSIFSFGRQKANSLTFCAKVSSDRRICPNWYWNRVEWTREMVFNSYHHTRTRLDKKIEIVEKKFKIIFSLPFSLSATLKRSLRSWFSEKNTIFLNFFSETMKSYSYMFIG